MDKNIIIDGVDVAECHNKTPYKNDYGDVQCKCYRFEDIENDTFLLGICKQHPNCYYKQFKRLEQENKELKEKIKKYSAINEQDTKDYVELKRENVRLFNESIELRAKNIEYRSALEEIRELVKADCKGCTAECDCDEDCTRYIIKNKINEVLQ